MHQVNACKVYFKVLWAICCAMSMQKYCNVMEDARSGEMLNHKQHLYSWLICVTGWRSYTMMAALQEASMNDCIGHAGMLSAAKFWVWSKLSESVYLEMRERSAISLQTPRTCTIRTMTLWWAAQKYNSEPKPWSVGSGRALFHMSTMALLLQWKRIFYVARRVPRYEQLSQ